ncbi:MAG: crossover junction endodeoxyribonuclease RuvC, partial [bacterium]|nr:crossover junction endodeoxyribonuclease RuvC [bacterium]
MKVIGLDPGIHRTGYAIIDIQGHDLRAYEYGCITTSAKRTLSERLVELQKDLVELLERHRPQAAVVERLVFVHNATSAIAV